MKTTNSSSTAKQKTIKNLRSILCILFFLTGLYTSSAQTYCNMTPNNANQSEIGSITFNGFTTPEAYANGNSCTVPAPGSGSIPGRYSDFSPLGSITVIERGQSI